LLLGFTVLVVKTQKASKGDDLCPEKTGWFGIHVEDIESALEGLE
jgi:hypothetical protein